MKLTDADCALLRRVLAPHDHLAGLAWRDACVATIAGCERFKNVDARDVWFEWSWEKYYGKGTHERNNFMNDWPFIRRENEHNRIVERKIIDAFCERSGWVAEKIELEQYKVDFALKEGDVIRAYAECKERIKDKSTAWDTVMLGISKVDALIRLGLYSKQGAFFVVQFSDGIFFMKLEYKHIAMLRERDLVWWLGRKDRNDARDYEPCARLPLDQFKPVDQFRPI